MTERIYRVKRLTLSREGFSTERICDFCESERLGGYWSDTNVPCIPIPDDGGGPFEPHKID